MSKVIILGSGAAPGVPCLSQGYGDCDPHNPKNQRLRTGTYLEVSGIRFLIDTSPDIRQQLLQHNLRALDAVFYTHVHADHLHGIDDLREVNRISGKVIDTFATAENMVIIKQRFGYLLTVDDNGINPIYRAALHPHIIEHNKTFFYRQLEVTPLSLMGHNLASTGYIFNGGEIVYIADFKSIEESSLALIHQRPRIMIMPLTTPYGTKYHAGFEDLLFYAQKLRPERLIINHMAVECDYDKIMMACKAYTSGLAEPAYDGMTIEL